MADQSDVENTLASLVQVALFPGQVTQLAAPAAMASGQIVTVGRGWPISTTLDGDLRAGRSQVTIFPEAMTRNTTRYEWIWRDAGNLPTAMSVSVSGNVIALSGSAAIGQTLQVCAGAGARSLTTYAVSTTANDSLGALGARLAAQIPGASSTASTVTVPALVSASVAAGGVGLLEVRRQEQVFRVSCWCPTPVARDQIASAIDGYMASIKWIDLPGYVSGRVIYSGSLESDQSEKAGLWVRHLRYRIEYPSTQQQTQPLMQDGVLNVSATVE